MNDLMDRLMELPPEKRRQVALLLETRGREFNAFPLSFTQEQLWFIEQLMPGHPTYNGSGAVKLAGELCLPALTQSLQEIVRRHEVLRTVFLNLDGKPIQVVRQDLGIDVPCVALSHLPEAQRPAATESFVLQHAQRPFALARGPLLRAALIRTARREHVLIVTIHHIVADGWSIGVLLRELVALYQAFLGGRPSPLPELPVQFADYAIWQRQRWQGEVLESSLACWKRQLRGDLPVVELPFARPRQSLRSFKGAKHPLRFSPALSKQVKALSEQERTTLFVVLLAGFNALLYCYTGQNDIVVGTPVANRKQSEIEGLIGCFANTVILRMGISGGATFVELLRHAHQVLLEAYANQDVPFEKIVEHLQPDRHLSQNPLFQVMFAFQNTPMPALELPGLTLSLADIDTGTAKFDLTLCLWQQSANIEGWFEYSTDLFEATAIRQMADDFERLLTTLTADPCMRLDEVWLFSEAERLQLLDEWPDTISPSERSLCIPDLIEAQIQRAPDAIAVVHRGQQLSYRRLNAEANRLANYLQSLGVGAEVPVAIYLQRSVGMMIALLGVLKAGGAYVPLNPGLPRERLATVLEDTGATVLVTETSLLETLPDHRAKTVCVDGAQEAIGRQSAETPRRQIVPENLAYIIYTSGSTGVPKGVLIPHRAVVNHSLAVSRRYGLEPQDRILQFYPISFDVAAEELFPTWLNGATVVLLEDGTAPTFFDLLKLIKREQLTVANLPTAYWHEWLGELSQDAGGLPASFRRLIIGNERALAERLQDWQSLVGDAITLTNAYGPTETTITATMYEPRLQGQGQALTSIPIGRPIDQVRVYVLNRRMRPVSNGLSGELHIGGQGVARGYQQRPELTAELFLPDPFVRRPGERMYKTGDYGRYLEGGDIEFLQRLDRQVKIRGHRVELGEIEAALSQHPQVQAAAVLARPTSAGASRLLAYVVGRPGSHWSGAQLRAYLKERLPEYMQPSGYVRLEAMPLQANGKLDYGRLGERAGEEEESGGGYEAPRTPLEQQVATLWQDALNTRRVSLHDNFFERGGHSLLAIQLLSRVRDAFGVEVPLRDLFQTPTVAGLAAQIEAAAPEAASPPARELCRLAPGMDRPLSYAQQRLWFLDRLVGGNPTYNLPAAIRLQGKLSVATLQQALNEIKRRHEILRTAFPVVNGRPSQVVEDADTSPLTIVDLRGLRREERQALTRRLAAEITQAPFALSQGGLLRTSLIRIDELEYTLLLSVHHIVADGWSVRLLIKEWSSLWEAFAAGAPSPLPDLTFQYADFAYRQRQWLEGGALEPQLTYWKRKLADAPAVLELPADYPRPAIPTLRGVRHAFSFSGELSDALHALSHSEGVTLFMTLLAALQVMLYDYTGREDMIVGTDVANRNRVETEGLIGLFVNQLVLRTDLSGNPTFKQLLGRVREVTVEACSHQDLPFDKLVEVLNPERRPNHNPLFQFMFVFEEDADPPLQLAGLTLSLQEVDTVGSPFDLSLLMSKSADSLRGVFRYNPDLFAPPTIAAMTENFRALLQAVTTRPEAKLTELCASLHEASRQSQAARLKQLKAARWKRLSAASATAQSAEN